MLKISELNKNWEEIEIEKINLKKVSNKILKNQYILYWKETLIIENLTTKDKKYLSKNLQWEIEIF